MDDPTPGLRQWRKSVRESGVSRAAIHYADWLVRHPVSGSPGMYASNQRRAAAVLHYGERTIRSAFSELVTAGLLVVIHRGIRQHPDTVVVLGKPVTYVSRSGDSQPALNRQVTPG